MLFELWNIIAPVFVCTIIGYFWARSSTPFSADFVSRIVMNIGAPCLVISTINGVVISGQDFYAVAFAAILIFLFMKATWCTMKLRIEVSGYPPDLLSASGTVT